MPKTRKDRIAEAFAEPSTVVEVADRLNLKPKTVSGVVKELVRAGKLEVVASREMLVGNAERNPISAYRREQVYQLVD